MGINKLYSVSFRYQLHFANWGGKGEACIGNARLVANAHIDTGLTIVL